MQDKRGQSGVGWCPVSVLSQRLAKLDGEWQAKVDAALLEGGARVNGARSVPLDSQRARAIPIIGKMSGGGHIPGTRPDQCSRRLGLWSGR